MLPRSLLPLFGLLVLQPGCGTMVNLWAPPKADHPGLYLGQSTCVPMGGALRSGIFAVSLPVVAGTGDFRDIGKGGIMQRVGIGAAGVIALADVPISFVGDIVTLPIVRARQGEASWATWWGLEYEQSETRIHGGISEIPDDSGPPCG